MIGLIILLAVVVILTKMISRFKTDRLSQFSGPKTKPLIGNLLDIGTKSSDIIQKMTSLLKTYGPITKLWLGPFHPIIIITDLDIVRYFLTSTQNLEKTHSYDILGSFLGKGLITSKIETWKIHRRMIEPAFSYKTFDSFITIFNEKLKVLTNLLDDKQSIDAMHFMHLYSLDVICEAAMGINMNVLTTHSEYLKAVSKVMEIIVIRIFSFHLRINWIYKWTPTYKIFKKQLKVANNVTKTVLEKARAQVKSNSNEKKKYKSFIDIFLSAESKDTFTDKEIEDQVNTFIFAGHDTVASAMSFALYEIGRNVEIQKNILDEVHEIVGTDKNADITTAHIQNFKYLDLVMRETLRKYPPAVFIERLVGEDVNIGGRFFPKNTNLNFFIYGIHNDERNYQNPEKFDPDRFLEDLVPFSYIPFSLGPRNCIGQRYANLIFKTTIAKLVLNYEITVPDNFEMQIGIKATITSLNGLPIYLKKR